MNLGYHSMTKTLARMAAVLVVGLAASACSTVPSWVDPTTWVGDSTAADGQSADQTAADNAAYPDLSKMPDRPAQPSTEKERQQVASSLASDRSQVEYSADALRGGTEAAAPPPPDTPPASTYTEPQTEAAPAEQAASADASNGSDNSAEAAASAAPDEQPAAPTSAIASKQMPPPAAAPSASGKLPAVPANAPGAAALPTRVAEAREPSASAMQERASVPGAQPSMVASSSAASRSVVTNSAGFQRSTAAPLDPSVAQFVPASVIARYDQTAAAAGVAGVNGARYAANTASGARRAAVSSNSRNVGGPESMGGAVVANMDATNPAVTQASVYANSNGLPAAAVVFFPNDTTILNPEGRAKVESAVEAFKARGGQGYVRVVGHSSSRTANMSVKRHLQLNFERSQARADAVARQLIKDGVPAAKVLVEAVGDSQPVYYESMPKGEEGNRRAEIFFQG